MEGREKRARARRLGVGGDMREPSHWRLLLRPTVKWLDHHDERHDTRTRSQQHDVVMLSCCPGQQQQHRLTRVHLHLRLLDGLHQALHTAAVVCHVSLRQLRSALLQHKQAGQRRKLSEPPND